MHIGVGLRAESNRVSGSGGHFSKARELAHPQLYWSREDGTKPAKLMEMFRVRQVKYLGEQDGPAERELKKQLSIVVSRKSTIYRAYLARVNYGQTNPEAVALCVRAERGPDDRQLAEDAGKIFASMFNVHEHLDVLFLKPQEEIELAKVCRPFFDREANQ